MTPIMPINNSQEKAEMLKVIAMSCPNCGAHLDVTSDLEIFTCAYCGSTIKVTRHGGTVSLVRIEQAISGIKTSTDRIAAELALKRLQRELGGVTAEIIFAQTDLETSQSQLRSVKTFDFSYPLKISGKANFLATPRNELTALIMWSVIAIVIGMLFGFATFAVVFAISWYGILASRNNRIREIEANNSKIRSTCARHQTHLDELRKQEISLNQQIRNQRSIIGAT